MSTSNMHGKMRKNPDVDVSLSSASSGSENMSFSKAVDNKCEESGKENIYNKTMSEYDESEF